MPAARWLAALLSAYFLADGWHFTPQSAGNTKSHVIDGSICGARLDPPVWIVASPLIINTRLLVRFFVALNYAATTHPSR